MQAQPTPARITFRIPGTKNYLHQGWLGLAYWKLSVLGWSRLLVLQHWSLSVCSMDRMERVWLARLRERLLSRLQGHFAGHALLKNSYYANWSYFRLFGMFSAEWEVLPPFSFGHASPFYTSQCAENFHGWKISWHPGEPRKWQKLAPYKNNLLYDSNESLQQIQSDYTYFPVALLFALMTSNCGVKFCKLYDVHASSYIERLFPKIETNADTT